MGSWTGREGTIRATEVARGPMHQTAGTASTCALPAPFLRFPRRSIFLPPPFFSCSLSVYLSVSVSRSVLAFLVNLGELAPRSGISTMRNVAEQ